MKYWLINSIQCIPKDGKFINIVYIINWIRVFDNKVNNIIYSKNITGFQNFPLPEESLFIPYDQLTFEQVCEWLDSTVNVSEIDAQLDVMMEQAINPPVIELPLPW